MSSPANQAHFGPRTWSAARRLRSIAAAAFRPASATPPTMISLRVRGLKSLHRLAMIPAYSLRTCGDQSPVLYTGRFAVPAITRSRARNVSAGSVTVCRPVRRLGRFVSRVGFRPQARAGKDNARACSNCRGTRRARSPQARRARFPAARPRAAPRRRDNRRRQLHGHLPAGGPPPPYRDDVPFVLGSEGAGTVAAMGPDVPGVRQGDRVAWTGISGCYAEQVIIPADRAVAVPEET